jgi:hypothetical protein
VSFQRCISLIAQLWLTANRVISPKGCARPGCR